MQNAYKQISLQQTAAKPAIESSLSYHCCFIQILSALPICGHKATPVLPLNLSYSIALLVALQAPNPIFHFNCFLVARNSRSRRNATNIKNDFSFLKNLHRECTWWLPKPNIFIASFFLHLQDLLWKLLKKIFHVFPCFLCVREIYFENLLRHNMIDFLSTNTATRLPSNRFLLLVDLLAACNFLAANLIDPLLHWAFNVCMMTPCWDIALSLL